MKKRNLVFIRGLYDTLDLFSEELAQALSERGMNCVVLDAVTLGDDLKELLTLHVTRGIDAVVAFNNLAYNLGTKEGGNLWDAMGVAYIDILMDHPFHFDGVLRALPEKTVLCCIDRNHVSYAGKYYPEIADVRFLPHAGCSYAIGDADPAAERDIDILYAGTLSRVLIESLIPDFDSIREFDGTAFSGRCLQRLIDEPSQTTEEVITDELKHEGLPSLSSEEERDYITLFRFLDGFAASFYREAAVRTLVENGVRVHVLGLGWEQCDWADNKNLVHLGKTGAKDVFSYMKRSKIALNTLTWFKDGAHDRIFNGMLSGAAVVTDSSEYLKEIVNDTQCVQYELKETDMLPDTVNELLRDNDRRLSIASRGKDLALSGHTWRNRADTILQILAENE